jgi:predicted RecA/RadA family phage recombinase
MKNFIQQGVNLTVPAPANTLSGEVVVIGDLHGVASINAAEGADLVFVTEGVFELPKVAANAFTVGAKVYYDSAAKLVTTTASGNTLIGAAVEAAIATTATVKVKIIH